MNKYYFHKFLKLAIIVLALSLKSTSISYAQNTSITTDSRIKTLVYNANEVYQLKFHYGYQSFIEFAEGESIEMISIGESFAWRLTPADRRLFVRPLEVAAHTNMTIITNKRTYQFDIRSGEYDGRADEELVYVVRFFFPDLRPKKPIPSQLRRPNPAAIAKPAPAVIRNPTDKLYLNKEYTGVLALNSDKNNINFDYQFAGNAPDITPIKIYDNGQETSMQFKNNNLIIPTISVVDIFGQETMVSYVLKDNYVVIPVVANQFTLRLADSMLCIFNNKIINGR